MFILNIDLYVMNRCFLILMFSMLCFKFFYRVVELVYLLYMMVFDFFFLYRFYNYLIIFVRFYVVQYYDGLVLLLMEIYILIFLL